MAVRNESVRLSLIDDFTTPMAKAAAATALLNRELNGLSGQAVKTSRVTQTIAQDNDRIARSANKADSSINQLTGRLRLFADLAAVLGPGLVPIGAVAIPAVAGLANQFGVAALAGGTAIIAFQGVGDALQAVNEAAIEPTTANLEKARAAMAQLSPTARAMVERLSELRPVLLGVRDAAAGGLFPGVIAGIDALETRSGDFERIVSSMGEVLGTLASEAGEALASDRWDDFFDFLATDAVDSMAGLGRVVGDLTHGLSELWMAFDPLNDDFSGWMQDVASGFDDWATGLSATEGFEEFIEYVRETGPQVAETFGALANAVLQIVEASAPLGGPVLAGLEAVAKVVAAIADSDIGTPILIGLSAMALLTRATAAYKGIAASAFGQQFGGMISGLTDVTSAQDRAKTSAEGLARQATTTKSALTGMTAGFAILGVVEGINLLDMALDEVFDRDLNTSTLGRSLEALSGGQVAGTLADVWGGDLEGLNRDLDTLDNNLARITDAPDKILPGDLTQTQQAEANIRRLDEALAGLVESGQRSQAEAIFEQLVAAAERGGNSASQLVGMLEQYQVALDNASGGGTSAADSARWLGIIADNAAPKVDMFGQAIIDVGGDAQDAADDVETLKGALEELSGLLNKRDAMRNYLDSIDDLRATVKEFGPASREAVQGFDDMVGGIVDVSSHMKGAAKTEFLDNAVADVKALAKELGIPPKLIQAVIDKLVKAANTPSKAELKAETAEANRKIDAIQELIDKYGMSKREARAMLEDVASGKIKTVQGLIDKYGLTKAEAKALLQDLASAGINNVRALLAGLHGNEAHTYTYNHVVTTYTTRRGNVSSAGGAEPGVRGFGSSADGGTVPKTGLPYADRHPYLLADGEEVISNRHGQADRNRELLKAINANRYAGRYAEGGTVRATSPTVNVSTGPLSATARLHPADAAAIASAVREVARAVAGNSTAAAQALAASRRAG